MSFPEWGPQNPTICGDSGGAASTYIQGMHDWMATHNFTWQVFFDVDPNCSYIIGATNQCSVVIPGYDHQMMPASDSRVATHYPKASKLYRKLFSRPLFHASRGRSFPSRN